MEKDKHFVYLIRPIREMFINTMTEEEEEIIEEHFDYLKSLLAAGRLVLAGPCLDGAFGIVIFGAESEEEARAVMQNDPAIARGVMTGEIHDFRVSLLGEI